MSKDIYTKNWGTDKIGIDPEGGPLIEFRPTELHLKEDGARDDKPSFSIVMIRPPALGKAVGQISLAMLNEALAELGYEITPSHKHLVVMQAYRGIYAEGTKEILFDTEKEAKDWVRLYNEEHANDPISNFRHHFKVAYGGAVPADYVCAG